ncbi:MAG: leucine-rich repeat domain-containing protein [Candidatus Helarchaeota archaeon]
MENELCKRCCDLVSAEVYINFEMNENNPIKRGQKLTITFTIFSGPDPIYISNDFKFIQDPFPIETDQIGNSDTQNVLFYKDPTNAEYRVVESQGHLFLIPSNIQQNLRQIQPNNSCTYIYSICHNKNTIATRAKFAPKIFVQCIKTRKNIPIKVSFPQYGNKHEIDIFITPSPAYREFKKELKTIKPLIDALKSKSWSTYDFSMSGVKLSELEENKIAEHPQKDEVLNKWKENTITLLTGPAGCGKSTLVKYLGYNLLKDGNTGGVYYIDFTDLSTLVIKDLHKFMDEFIQEILSISNTINNPIYIIIENVHANLRATERLNTLKNIENLHILLTSRNIKEIMREKPKKISDSQLPKNLYWITEKERIKLRGGLNLIKSILIKNNIKYRKLEEFCQEQLGLSELNEAPNLWVLRFYLSTYLSKSESIKYIDELKETDLRIVWKNYIIYLTKQMNIYNDDIKTTHIEIALIMLSINSKWEIYTEASYLNKNYFRDIIIKDEDEALIKNSIKYLAKIGEIIEIGLENNIIAYRIPHSKFAELILKFNLNDKLELQALSQYLTNGLFFGALIHSLKINEFENYKKIINILKKNKKLNTLSLFQNRFKSNFILDQLGTFFNTLIDSFDSHKKFAFKLARYNSKQILSILESLDSLDYNTIMILKSEERLLQRIPLHLLITNKIGWWSIGFQIDEKRKIVGLSLYWLYISNLLYDIVYLKQLKYLNLSMNKLKTLPDFFHKLESLQELYLGINQLRTLPESFGNLKSLRELYLGVNKLRTLPDSFGNMSSLQILNLSKNELTTLPESFSNLKSLRILSLSNNQLRTLPESFGNLKSLQILDLRYNQLTTLPESFGNLKSLQELYLGVNQLRTLPESFGSLKSLQILDLSSIGLRILPESFGDLKSLRELNLRYNQLKTLPELIFELKNLENLSLEGNQLTTLPESLSNLKSLRELNLRYNQLKTFPEPIFELKNLENLSLGGNQLRTLPESFGNLKSLQRLELWHNQLRTLPESLCKMPNLKEIWVSMNLLGKQAKSVIKRCKMKGTIIY